MWVYNTSEAEETENSVFWLKTTLRESHNYSFCKTPKNQAFYEPKPHFPEYLKNTKRRHALLTAKYLCNSKLSIIIESENNKTLISCNISENLQKHFLKSPILEGLRLSFDFRSLTKSISLD